MPHALALDTMRLMAEEVFPRVWKEAWDLFQKMTNSRGKRFVVIGDGTHYMEFEKRREELYREVENFLES